MRHGAPVKRFMGAKSVTLLRQNDNEGSEMPKRTSQGTGQERSATSLECLVLDKLLTNITISYILNNPH
jgi:hypothetical protein